MPGDEPASGTSASQSGRNQPPADRSKGPGQGTNPGGDGSEAAVLDAALEAMERSRSDPSLEDRTAKKPGDGDGDGGGNDNGKDGSGASAGNGQGGAGGTEQLDQELDAALGRFDGGLSDERARGEGESEELGDDTAQQDAIALLDEAEGGSESNTDYGTALPGRTQGELDEEGESAAADGNGNGGKGSVNSSGNGMVLGDVDRKGDYTHTNTASNVPADIPSGTDDDVVARQIREAATKEKDPELRAKLWDEYRRYIGAPKGRS